MEGRHAPRHAAPENAQRQTRRDEAQTSRLPRDEKEDYVPRRSSARNYDDEYTMPKKRPSVIGMIIKDLLLTVFLLCIFSLFHHVLPRLTASSAEMPTPTAIVAQTAEPEQSAAPEQSAEPEPSATPEVVDNRTEWQKKFAEHFTDEIVSTETSYSSPNISINITTVSDVINDYHQTYYIADIYVAQIENFQTYFANGQFSYYGAENPTKIAQNSGSILAVNGDYCNNQKSGFLVRNGELYYDQQTTADICVLYYDGTMETFGASEYKVEDIIAKNPYQVWKFGPELLDDNGQPAESYNTGIYIKCENPRTGIGYYEPGHYCFITVDGRQSGWSRGFEIKEFAQLFTDLGCKAAYNLDGGASAVMAFNGEVISRPSGKRDLGDILIIRELSDEDAQPDSSEGQNEEA